MVVVSSEEFICLAGMIGSFLVHATIIMTPSLLSPCAEFAPLPDEPLGSRDMRRRCGTEALEPLELE